MNHDRKKEELEEQAWREWTKLVTGEKDSRELVLRTGDAAPVPPPVQEIVNTSISGPFEFFRINHNMFITGIDVDKDVDKEESEPVEKNYPYNNTLLLANEQKGELTLKTNITDPYQTIIQGRLVYNPEIEKLGINNSKKVYSIDELRRVVKQSGYLFQHKSQQMKTLERLHDFNAKVTQNHTKSNNDKGRIRNMFFQDVEGDDAIELNLLLPIFLGEELFPVNVEVIPEFDNQDIVLYLVSDNLRSVAEDLKKQALEEQINLFKHRFNIPILYLT